jgi:two-component system sensor histidine kinase YesM
MISVKRNLLSFFKDLKIKNKLLLSCIPLIFIPITVITLFSYKKTSQIIEQQVIESARQSFEQANRFISYKLDNIKDVSSMLYVNKNLQDILGKSMDNYDLNQQIDDYKRLLDIIHSAENSKEVFSIRLYVNNSSIYSKENDEIFSAHSVEDMPWFEKVLENRGAMYWRSTYKLHTYDNQQDQYLISCVRTINDERYGGRAVGMVSVDILEDTFSRL